MEQTYRNQTSTITKINMIANLKITTTQEAVAFLRAIANVNMQIAQVLQNSSLKEQQLINHLHTMSSPTPPQPEPVTPTPAKDLEPEVFTEEKSSEDEVEDKINKLKEARLANLAKARAAKKAKKESKGE